MDTFSNQSLRKAYSKILNFYSKIKSSPNNNDYLSTLESAIEFAENYKNNMAIGPFFYYLADLKQRKIIFSKGTVNQILGITHQDLLNSSFLLLFKFLSIANFLSYLKSAYTFYNYYYSLEIEKRKKIRGFSIFPIENKNNETKIILQQTMVAHMDDEGKITHLLNCLTDVTGIIPAKELKFYLIDQNNEEETETFPIELFSENTLAKNFIE